MIPIVTEEGLLLGWYARPEHLRSTRMGDIYSTIARQPVDMYRDLDTLDEYVTIDVMRFRIDCSLIYDDGLQREIRWLTPLCNIDEQTWSDPDFVKFRMRGQK